MIYYRCIDAETEASLQKANALARNLFYNMCRLINCGGGFPIVIEAGELGISLTTKYVSKGQPTNYPFPYKRILKIVAAVNAVVNLKQNHWPVLVSREVVEGKWISMIRIVVNAKAAAIFQRRCAPLLPALHIDLPRSRLGELFPDFHKHQLEPLPSVQGYLARPIEPTLGLDDEEIDHEETQDTELETEPYQEDEDLI